MSTKYEYYDIGGDGNDYAYGAQWRAQTFTPSVEHIIKSARVYLRRHISYPSNYPVILAIRDVNVSGHPESVDLCVGEITGSDIGTSYVWHEATFAITPTLAAGIKYALVIRAPDRPNFSCYWYIDTTNGDYLGGNREYSSNSGSSWTASSTQDGYFQEWGDLPPSGWAGKISGVTNPAKIMGVGAANIAKVKGVA